MLTVLGSVGATNSVVSGVCSVTSAIYSVRASVVSAVSVCGCVVSGTVVSGSVYGSVSGSVSVTGSVSGSVLATFLYVACSEWWLRFLDMETYIGAFKVPLLRSGFRMVVFSVVIMIIVLFFSKGIMGDKELSWEGIGGALKKLKAKLSKKQTAEAEVEG